MSKKEKLKRIKVSFPAWSESEKSWYLLTKRSPNKKGWSEGKWFPKKLCDLKESKKEVCVGILTMPKWLYKKMFKNGNVSSKTTEVKKDQSNKTSDLSRE